MLRGLLIGIFVAFAAYTVWIIYDEGYSQVIIDAFSRHTTTQVFLDLSIACLLLNLIMVRQHLKSGKPFKTIVPYLMLTLFLGSFGPLLYFIRQGELVDLFSLKGRKSSARSPGI